MHTFTGHLKAVTGQVCPREEWGGSTMWLPPLFCRSESSPTDPMCSLLFAGWHCALMASGEHDRGNTMCAGPFLPSPSAPLSTLFSLLFLSSFLLLPSSLFPPPPLQCYRLDCGEPLLGLSSDFPLGNKIVCHAHQTIRMWAVNQVSLGSLLGPKVDQEILTLSHSHCT